MAYDVPPPHGFTNEEWAQECAAADALNWEEPNPQPWNWPKPPPGHMVYFVGGLEGPIKIGFTQQPMPARLKCLQNGSPIRLHVLATQPAFRAREAFYHRQFAAHRLVGEWFERVPEIEAEIERLNQDRPAGRQSNGARTTCHRRA